MKSASVLPTKPASTSTHVMRDATLRAEWMGELRAIVAKIVSVRALLAKELVAAGATPPGTNSSWAHIEEQIGMFAYTGLSPEQVAALRAERNIYMTLDGRLSLAGLATKDVPYVAASIAGVV